MTYPQVESVTDTQPPRKGYRMVRLSCGHAAFTDLGIGDFYPCIFGILKEGSPHYGQPYREHFALSGQVRRVVVQKYLNGSPIKTGERWVEAIFVERPEDWYALESMKGKIVMVVTRENWNSSIPTDRAGYALAPGSSAHDA